MKRQSVDFLLSALAATRSDSVAAVCGAQRLTYGDLGRRSDVLASALVDRGVRAEMLVGIAAERTIDSLVGLLAIWKAGGAFLPLDPSHPHPWLEAIVQQARPLLVLESSRRHENLHALDLPFLAIADEGRPEAAPFAPRVRHPETMAYCNFTSGTTGPPKGVMVPDRSLVNHCRRLRDSLALTARDRVLQATPLSVDAALEEILPTMLAGATLAMPETPLVPGDELMRFLAESRVSVVSLATSLWDRWLEHEGAPDWVRPPDLRLVFVGGERVHARKLKRWQALPWTCAVQWLTDYGPTEGTISCTLWQAPDHFVGNDIPIGEPIGGTRVDVLDDALEPVATGVVGSLWLAGDAPARGYLDRPSLTADRFRPDPLGLPGGRRYDSGDRGWRAPSGALHFAGRRDGQIKVSGLRVEIDRIEEHLLECPGVRDAAVVLQDGADDSILTAFVTAATTDESRLRRLLAAGLPAAMIPDRIVLLPELPRKGPAGKIDRALLQSLVPGAEFMGEASPRDRVAACWSATVGRAPLHNDEGFYEAGGDSLRALRLLRLLRKEFGADLRYEQLAAQGSVSALVAALETDSGTNLAPTPPAPRGTAEFDSSFHQPSHGQRRLWFLDRRDPGTASYALPLVFEIEGAIDPGAFDVALNALVGRHEALRSAFHGEGDQLHIHILPRVTLETTRLTAADMEAGQGLLRVEMAKPFDLTRAPLIRSCRVRIGENRHLWLVNAHHSIVDAWSLDVMMGELGALLGGAVLPPPSGQMRDHVAREAELLASGADAERRFWSEALSGPLPTLDLSHGAPAEVDAGGGFMPLALEPALAGALRRVASQRGTTPFIIALSAFAAALHRWTLDERLVIGVPAACRDGAEQDTIVGFLVNTLPLVLDIEPHMPFAALVAQVAERLGGAIGCQKLPLDEILTCRGTAGPRGHNDLIRTMFVLQDTPMAADLEVPGCRVRELALHNGSAKMDLTLTLRSDGAALTGGLEFARAALSEAEAASFRTAFLEMLDAGLRQPDLPLHCAPTQPAEATAAAARAANRAREDYGAPQTLLDGFLHRCRQAPEDVALESSEGSMRYFELDEASAAAASALVEGGVGPETLVGLCMERSFSCIVAMLGILRAGGAFVPLSASAPPERNRLVARAARLEHIVTDPEGAAAFAGLKLRIWRAADLNGPKPWAARPVIPAQLAYCYFTSGSTGVPKGVAIDHSCAAGRLEWLRRRYPLAPGTALIHKTPLIFDVAIWEIFAPLAEGATVLLAASGEEGDPLALTRLLERPETAAIHFVPSLLDAFLATAPPANPPALRWLQLSGESPSADLVGRVRAHFRSELHNCYGQTETSEVACWEDDGSPLGRHVPIGTQVGLYRLFLVDAAFDLVPDGMPGEIAVAAVGGLARCYLGNPRLTAQRFVPNPFPCEPGERLYLTGDVGRRNRRGQIEVVGRTDDQLKIRGCRVEPLEVEQVLRRHSLLSECAVVAGRDSAGNNELIAYVVGSASQLPGLFRHAQTHLPDYMLPAALVRIDRLPLTAAGKLDRAALPPPRPEDYCLAPASEPPRGGMERDVAAIWLEVLGERPIGREDSFFSVGGNSLSAIHILSRIRARFGVDVSVRDFFERPTIAQFVPFLDSEMVRLIATMSDAELADSLARVSHG